MDFVFTGITSWNFPLGNNAKDLAIELSKNHRVLYVNVPTDSRTNLLNPVKKVGCKAIQQINPNLWVLTLDKKLWSINWLPKGQLYSILLKTNGDIFAKEILRAIKVLEFKEINLFCDNDMHRSFYLKEIIKPKRFIYYSRDNLIGVPYWEKHGVRLEPELIAKSDICFSNSNYLHNYLKMYNSNSHFIGQGVDLRRYLKPNLKMPSALEFLRIKPVIGYAGNILASRLDLDLIRELVTRNPEWNFVFVGPEDKVFKESDLHLIPNVYFLGAKFPEVLPAYIYGFDVCINPQKVNNITIGNYPRKIDEYLVMGKPVVATETEAMQYFNNYCLLAKDAKEFEEKINFCLQKDDLLELEKGRQFALSHTWEACTNLMLSHLNT